MAIHWRPAPILWKEAEDAHNGDSVNILNGGRSLAAPFIRTLKINVPLIWKQISIWQI